MRGIESCFGLVSGEHKDSQQVTRVEARLVHQSLLGAMVRHLLEVPRLLLLAAVLSTLVFGSVRRVGAFGVRTLDAPMLRFK